MKKYSFLLTYIVILIILYIGSITTTNAAVGNICTSASIKELNKTITKRVTVKVKEKEWFPGSKIRVKVDVGKKKSIRNLVIWAETVDGMHIGYWSPVSAHVYVSGCNGPANSTITNQVDLNLSRVTYEWNSPNEPLDTSVTPTPSTTQSYTTTSSTYSSKAVTAPTPSISTIPKHYNLISAIMQAIKVDNTKNQNINSSAKRESIIFKGVLQLMNHPDVEIYSFKSHVIQKNLSVSKKENSISGKDHILNVSQVNNNIPENPPFSAAYSNNINLLVLNSMLAFVLLYYFSIYN